MCLKLIGRKKNLEVYRDINYTFPDPIPVVIDKEKQKIIFGSKIFVFADSFDFIKIFQVKINKWVVVFKNILMELEINFDTPSASYWAADYKDFHITESGIYLIKTDFWGYGSFNSLDFRSYKKEKFDIITFYKKFIIAKRELFCDIFVNTDDLPDFDINLNHPIYSYYRSSKDKILVHFKDVSKKIVLNELLYFASELISDQLSSLDSEVHLDIDYSDFKKESPEVLDYLKSLLIHNCNILDEIF